MNYIQGHCQTNLDDYDCSLVKVFAAIPNKGDYVDVLYKGGIAALVVVSIKHKCRNGSTPNPQPYIEVELHKPQHLL